MRGTKFRRRDPSELSAKDQTRIDICWSVACSLGMVDLIRGADFQARHLLLALKAGEPYRVARALAVEAAYAALGGMASQERAQKLLTTTDALVEATNDPHARGWATGVRGFLALQSGRFAEGLAHADKAEEIFRDQCTGAIWERDTTHLIGMWSMYYLGRLAELHRRVASRLREANERGDLYLSMPLRTGPLNAMWLVRGDVDGARAAIAGAMRLWTSREPDQQNFNELLAVSGVDLYAGEATRAYQRLSERLPSYERLIVSRVQITRLETYHLRGRAALAAALEHQGAERTRLLGEARKDARRIASDGAPWAMGLATLLEAGVIQASGDLPRAIATYRAAAEALGAFGLGLFAVSARYRAGELEGNVAEPLGWLQREKVKDPARLMSLFAPALLAK